MVRIRGCGAARKVARRVGETTVSVFQNCSEHLMISSELGIATVTESVYFGNAGAQNSFETLQVNKIIHLFRLVK